MICYELKKVLKKKSNQMVLLILAGLVAFCCHMAIHSVEWIDGNGNMVTGIQAGENLRAAQKPWSGTLDEELLEKALAEIQRAEASEEYQAKDYWQNRIAQGWMQGVREIQGLLCVSFSDNFRSVDERTAGQIKPEELHRFYDNRVELLRSWLYEPDSSGAYLYSAREKEFLLERCSQLETPFQVGYAQGWIQAANHMGWVLKFEMILLGFLLSGIFSGEFQWKAEPVYYSSLHGRRKGTKAKIAAGLLLITGVYLLCAGSYSLSVLGSLGTDGADYPVQSTLSGWKSVYNLTFREKYGLILVLGYIGYLFFGMLVMWVSAKTKSPVLAVMIPSLGLLLPGFLTDLGSGGIFSKALALLPNRLLDGNIALSYLDVVSLGKTVVTPIPVLILVYIACALALTVGCYGAYRHKAIGG